MRPYLAMPKADARNRRREVRRRVLKEARIILNDRFSVIDATVRDLSVKGCRLRLHHAMRLPADFIVAFPTAGTKRQALLVWQRGNEAGARFIDPPPEEFLRLLPY